MKNLTNNRIKGLAIALLLVAATFIGFIALTPAKACAAVGDYILDHSADPAAPDVKINAVTAASIGLYSSSII